jgi:hypothetical protein
MPGSCRFATARTRIHADTHQKYRRVAAGLPQQFPRVDLAAVLDLVAANAHAVPSVALETQVSADLDDDKLLACAHTSGAVTILRRDEHLPCVSAIAASRSFGRAPSSNVTRRRETTRSQGARAGFARVTPSFA